MVYTRVVRTRLFRTNRTQAVRFPKEMAFDDKTSEVVIFKEGIRRVVVPADAAWDDFFNRPPIDFPEREQPIAERRAKL